MDHSMEFLEITDDAKSRVKEVTVAEARERLANGAVLVDVREDREWSDGHAAGAIHMGRGVIERDIVSRMPDKSSEIILYCGGGYRSALAADSIQKMGYTNIFSLAGGWSAWKNSGGPEE
jgi:rhodanese-related sulfurtransferase